MSKSRPQPTTGGVSCRQASASPADRRATTTTPPATRAPSTRSLNCGITSVPTNYRDRLMVPSRPKSSGRLIPDTKAPTNSVGRSEPPPKQITRQDWAGNRKSPRYKNRRPPFVVGTGNSTVSRVGGVYRDLHSMSRSESRSLSGATSSKDRREITGSVAKDSGTELKTKKTERPAAHATETMTLISNDNYEPERQSRDRAEKPDVIESSGTFIVADSLTEVLFHRTNQKQHHQSADECIKQVAEKLSEFAATQNDASDTVKSVNSTGVKGHRNPTTRNNVTKDSCRRTVAKSPRLHRLAQDSHLETSQAATISGGYDVSSASKRACGTSKKAAEVNRNCSTRASAACRPSPTRSSLLRQALNCPGSGATQQRVRRPVKPTVGDSHPGTENHLQTPQQQPVAKPGHGRSARTPHNAADRPTK